jgi:hypothetical protein
VSAHLQLILPDPEATADDRLEAIARAAKQLLTFVSDTRRQMRRTGELPPVAECRACSPHDWHQPGLCYELDRWGEPCACDTPFRRASPKAPKQRGVRCECGHAVKSHKPECFHKATNGELDCECTRFRSKT